MFSFMYNVILITFISGLCAATETTTTEEYEGTNNNDDYVIEDEAEYPVTMSDLEYKLLEEILNSAENVDEFRVGSSSEPRHKRSIADYVQFLNNIKTLGIGISGDIGIGLRLGSGSNEINGMRRVQHTNNIYDRYIGTNFHTIINGHLGHNSQEQNSNSNGFLYYPANFNPQQQNGNNTFGSSTNSPTNTNSSSTAAPTGGGSRFRITPDNELIEEDLRKLAIENPRKWGDDDKFEATELIDQKTAESSKLTHKTKSIKLTANKTEIDQDDVNYNSEKLGLSNDQHSTTTQYSITNPTTSTVTKKKKTILDRFVKYLNSDRANLRFFKNNETLSKVFEKFFAKYINRGTKLKKNLTTLGKANLNRYLRSVENVDNNRQQQNASFNTEQSPYNDTSLAFRDFIINMAARYLLLLPDKENKTQNEKSASSGSLLLNETVNSRSIPENEYGSENNGKESDSTIDRIRNYLLKTPLAEMMKNALQELREISSPERNHSLVDQAVINEDGIWTKIINYVYRHYSRQNEHQRNANKTA